MAHCWASIVEKLSVSMFAAVYCPAPRHCSDALVSEMSSLPYFSHKKGSLQMLLHSVVGNNTCRYQKCSLEIELPILG
eukprot:c31461_g1_i1 orf=1-231(-)